MHVNISNPWQTDQQFVFDVMGNSMARVHRHQALDLNVDFDEIFESTLSSTQLFDSSNTTDRFSDFTNLLLCELPRGDFAFTLCRQFLYDAYSLPFTQALCKSADSQLAAIAAKAEKESRYLLRRSRDWMLRLGDGTAESHERCQNALDQLWIYTDEMFECDALLDGLIATGVAVNTASLRSEWLDTVTETLHAATLVIPEAQGGVTGGREGIHTDDLGFLLAEMQFMQRAYPGLQW